jgi:hypothetical protein
MSIFSGCWRSSIVLVCVVVLHGTAYGGGPPLDLDGSEWAFQQTLAKVKAKAQGIGMFKISGSQGVEMTLLAGNAWLAAIDDTVLLQGTYIREGAAGTRLLLTLDAASAETLQDLYAQQVAAAAAARGLALNVAVTLAKARAMVGIKLRRKTGSATAKLKMALNFTAAVSTASGAASTGKIVGKLKGVSAPIPMIDIIDAAPPSGERR